MYVRDREGLGKAWYEKALDFGAEAGSAILSSAYGPAAGQALKAVHQAWTGAAFGPDNKPQPPAPSAPPPPSAPAAAPVYRPAAPAAALGPRRASAAIVA